MQTQYESHETVYINSISSFQPGDNFIILKKVSDNINARTKAGIYKTSNAYNRDQYLPQNVDRVFEVIKTPEEFTDEPNEGYWKTKIEVKKGDIVIINYSDSLGAKELIEDDGTKYRVIKYYALIVAIRNGLIIPLNGYLLFSRLYEEIKIQSQYLEIPKKAYKYDPRVGKIEHIGNTVEYYYRNGGGDFDKGINVKVFDNVMFLTPYTTFAPILEHPMFKILDKEYLYCQRYRLAGVLK